MRGHALISCRAAVNETDGDNAHFGLFGHTEPILDAQAMSLDASTAATHAPVSEGELISISCSCIPQHPVHVCLCCFSNRAAPLFCMPSSCHAPPSQPFQDMHASEPHFVPCCAAGQTLGRGCLAHCADTMPEPVHADMRQRAEAEQQGPAQLKATILRRSKRMTTDRRVPIGQESEDTGRVAKRSAEQCDETAHAPQPKRQCGESKDPDCQQASEGDPTHGSSAVPAPAAAKTPAAARDPFRDDTVLR